MFFVTRRVQVFFWRKKKIVFANFRSNARVQRERFRHLCNKKKGFVCMLSSAADINVLRALVHFLNTSLQPILQTLLKNNGIISN